MGFKTIVFDLDGTISDPSIGYLNGINYALKTLGKEPYNDIDYKKYLGTPLHISFKNHFFKEYPYLVDEAILLFREYYGKAGKYENTLYEGIFDLIKTLSVNYDLYILTNKTHQFAIDIIQHFELSNYFKGIYGLDTLTVSTKTEIAIALNQSLFKNNESILMIGDTIHDINCAKEAEWKSCYVSYGFGNKEDLEFNKPNKMVETVAELAEYLKSV